MTTITEVIPPLPAAPDPATMTRNEFSAAAAAFVLAQKGDLVPSINTWAGQVNTVKGEMAADAATATTQAGNAAASAVAAANQVTLAAAQVTLATNQANAAAASALTAINAPGTSATSSTSLTIASGVQNLTIQTGKAFSVGQSVTVAYTTMPYKRMGGVITAYDSGTGALTVNVDQIADSGTFSNWTVSLGALPAAGASLPPAVALSIL